MNLYKIIGAIGPDNTTLSVRQDQSERFTIVLGGPRGGAALFSQDRLVLYLDRDTTLVWRLIQDDVHRASIQEGGACPIHPLSIHSLRRRLKDRILGRPGSAGVSRRARHIQVHTPHGRFQLCDPAAGWTLNVYSPSGESAGHIRRLPERYDVQVSDGQDPFLLLGIALYVLAKAQLEERRAREPILVPGDTVIVQPGHPAPPVVIPPRYPRRRWIDDPIKDSPRWIDDPLEKGRRWIDDPVDEHPPHVPEPQAAPPPTTAQEAEQAL